MLQACIKYKKIYNLDLQQQNRYVKKKDNGGIYPQHPSLRTPLALYILKYNCYDSFDWALNSQLKHERLYYRITDAWTDVKLDT